MHTWQSDVTCTYEFVESTFYLDINRHSNNDISECYSHGYCNKYILGSSSQHVIVLLQEWICSFISSNTRFIYRINNQKCGKYHAYENVPNMGVHYSVYFNAFHLLTDHTKWSHRDRTPTAMTRQYLIATFLTTHKYSIRIFRPLSEYSYHSKCSFAVIYFFCNLLVYYSP